MSIYVRLGVQEGGQPELFKRIFVEPVRTDQSTAVWPFCMNKAGLQSHPFSFRYGFGEQSLAVKSKEKMTFEKTSFQTVKEVYFWGGLEGLPSKIFSYRAALPRGRGVSHLKRKHSGSICLKRSAQPSFSGTLNESCVLVTAALFCPDNVPSLPCDSK